MCARALVCGRGPSVGRGHGCESVTTMCVQDADDRCALQFTLRIAAGCALHRRASRVIHRTELFVGDAGVSEVWVVCLLGRVLRPQSRRLSARTAVRIGARSRHSFQASTVSADDSCDTVRSIVPPRARKRGRGNLCVRKWRPTVDVVAPESARPVAFEVYLRARTHTRAATFAFKWSTVESRRSSRRSLWATGRARDRPAAGYSCSGAPV